MKPIRQKIEKRLNELKDAPSVKKTLPEKPVLNKSHVVKTQKGITPLKGKPKLQTPTIKPNEPIKKTLKDSKEPSHESKPILTRYPQYQTGQVKQKQEPLVTKKPALQKVAPLVAIIPPVMAMHLIRKAQNQELKASKSPNFSIQKSSPSIALEPKVVPKTKYVVPQVIQMKLSIFQNVLIKMLQISNKYLKKKIIYQIKLNICLIKNRTQNPGYCHLNYLKEKKSRAYIILLF
ncbi:MAG: hypothetical protein V8R01_00910 [Bacilli bacterium]